MLSPLLCNIALHGMEQVAATAMPPKRGRPRLIRYADDLVVLHPEVEGVEAAQRALSTWLAEIGLEFKPSKTRITHTLHEHQGQVGFDFLGCTIRQFPMGHTRTGRTTSGQPLGFTTRITPSKEAITRHTADLGTVIRHHRTVSQEELIGLLTPKIRGWAAYYRG